MCPHSGAVLRAIAPTVPVTITPVNGALLWDYGGQCPGPRHAPIVCSAKTSSGVRLLACGLTTFAIWYLSSHVQQYTEGKPLSQPLGYFYFIKDFRAGAGETELGYFGFLGLGLFCVRFGFNTSLCP